MAGTRAGAIVGESIRTWIRENLLNLLAAFAGSGTLPLSAFASRFWLFRCWYDRACRRSEPLLHLLSSGTWPHHPFISVKYLGGDR